MLHLDKKIPQHDAILDQIDHQKMGGALIEKWAWFAPTRKQSDDAYKKSVDETTHQQIITYTPLYGVTFLHYWDPRSTSYT